MDAAPAQPTPVLRLVNAAAETEPAPRRGRHAPAQAEEGRRAPHRAAGAATPAAPGDAWAVAAENRIAAGLSAGDARWVMAVMAAQALEGGAAAVLRPERRARLLRLATRLGLRPFDAALVIAIVQDAARSGQAPLGPATEERLRLVAPVRRAAEDVTPGRLLLAVALGAALFGLLLAWLRGA